MNITCMKWGDKFPVDYVNRLYAMVSQNMDSKFRFVCFTENSIGIRPEVEIETNLSKSYLRSIFSNTIYKFD